MKEHLLFLTPGLGKGGAETQLLKVATESSATYEVLIIALKPINNFSEDLKIRGIKVLFLQKWKTHFFSNLITLISTLRSFKPTVVIAFMFVAIIVARLLKVFFKYKLISSVRNSVIGKKWSLLYKLTYKLDDAVVFNSNASKKNFERLKIISDNSLVINNAISIPVDDQIKVAVASDPFVWISMAHFRPSKDYDTLFEAIKLLQNQNFRVDIIGHLNNLAWPARKINDLGIQTQVRLLGFKKNALEYLNTSNALVLSSFNEGMPNAILEAMSFGKPVVASAIDGINELLTNSGCGLLFEAGNANDLADKMKITMNLSNEQVCEISSKGRSYILEHFADQTVKGQWMTLIRRFSSDGKVVLA